MNQAVSITDQDYFSTLADAVCTAVGGSERTTLLLKAECSDFIRFNHGLLRQATDVRQAHATLAVVAGRRRIESTLSLSGNADADRALLLGEREQLARLLPEVPDDPYLLLPDTVTDSHREQRGQLPAAGELIRSVSEAARGLDLVGFYAAGPVVRAFADSRGQRNWHQVEHFHFDWCIYQSGDKAIKTALAGADWDATMFADQLAMAAQRLPLLARTPRLLPAGAYRALLAPRALAELLDTAAWGGFGAKARRTGTSSLHRLALAGPGGTRLHPSIDLREATADGLAPAFTDEGFVKPAEVTLIAAGKACEMLVSPRSSTEFGLPANGANATETPESLRLAAGTIAAADALRALDRGLYISDLWYLNYSDRSACRMTGMTRFACFWVEDGELVEPLQVMRFDDSFLRMFGSGLIGLTAEVEVVPDSSTYGERQLGSVTTPGALIDGLQLTL
ncbi:metallopeptidase TldD-related protein [Piscinibacter sakaiensis]|uniref:metallopeptidase TldD-related protein n=1 Tax=Piscinibacter sakaiensis TaxID=1547922 RepID=UPI003AB0D128